MKVGGGLNYVTGPMGSGKSLYGVRALTQHICTGRYVVTNVRLYDSAFDTIAGHVGNWRTKTKQRRMADKLRALYVYETDLQAAMRYRVPGRGEGRALFVWDETHNDLNNRNWRDESRIGIVEWATQLRKLGFTGYLLSQHHENTDAALRRVCGYLIRLQNQREQTRLLGLRVSPWPLFLAYWYPTNIPAGSKAIAVKVDRYFLSWHRHLYDTHDLYHGLASVDEDGVILLPEGGRALDAAASEAPVNGGEATGRTAAPPIHTTAFPAGGNPTL